MRLNKRIVSGSLDMLIFLFPNYEVIYDIPEEVSRPCIYAGKLDKLTQLKEKYEEAHQDYIVFTRGPSEIDIKDRFMLADVVFDKYNRNVPKYLANIINDFDEETFIRNIKTYWITGKWETKKLDNEDGFLDFVETINKSSMEMYSSYFRVIKSIKSYRLESSLLTFFLRAKEGNTSEVSYKYKKKLDLFKGDKINLVYKGINKSFNYNIDNYDLKLLNMIMCIMDAKNNI